ncbi:MAG: winged helix-turn-helix domain-containing protein [Clostridia bacterium]|nr:winged helix-turn-helix domain-containing protein [Clostridia bacterium]
MTKRRAFIFSNNEAISKIVLAELTLLGYTPKTVQDVPLEKDAVLIVFDATSLELSPSIRSFITSFTNAKKIVIVNDISEKLSPRFDKTFVFPFLLSDLRAAILDAGDNQGGEDSGAFSLSKCFTLEKDKKGVSFDGVFVPLSTYELNLLKLLCDNSGYPVSREQILGLFESSDSNLAEVYICHLRNKLELPFGIKVIYTVRGKGYMTDYKLVI